VRDYELVVVVSPEAGEEGFPVTIDRITNAIKDRSCDIKNVDLWGRRRLAYPIRRYMDGFYAIFQFEGEPSAIRPLESSLDLADDVLRHLVVRLDEPAPVPPEPAEPVEAAEPTEPVESAEPVVAATAAVAEDK
jgi:small subunit ribosomal protein S6